MKRTKESKTMYSPLPPHTFKKETHPSLKIEGTTLIFLVVIVIAVLMILTGRGELIR
ncbi:MAG: hypothetical protein QM485_12330 [Flavobacteriaceae bacterium]